MSRATVLALAESYAFDLDGFPQLESYYDDLMWDAARWGVSTSCQLVETTRDTGEYTLPEDCAREYAIFYDDLMLSRMDLRDLESVNPLWRDATGRPRAYIVQDQPEHRIRLYPVPDESSTDFSFIFGSPVGVDFPLRSLGVIQGERREDLPAWLDIPLALAILSREFERESAHRDPLFAKAARDVGNQLLAMVLV